MTQAQNKFAAIDQRVADGKQADQAQTQTGPQTPDQQSQTQPAQDKANEKADQGDKKQASA